MMLQKIVNYLFVFSFVLFISCAPQTKEAYLQDYKEFIADVSKNSKEYTAEDWKKADEEYKKYSKDWKMKFSDELTILEKGVLLGNEIEYNLYRVKQPLLDILNNYVSDDYEKIKQQIKEYQDKDMQDDIEELVKKAEKIGGEAQKAVEEIVEELSIKTEE